MFNKMRVKLDSEEGLSNKGKQNEANSVQAVALRYEPEKDEAPRLIAKGKGEIAERIIQIAKENQIPIQEDPLLVAALSELDLYQVIPPELYEVVAEVLAYIYRIRKSYLSR